MKKLICGILLIWGVAACDDGDGVTRPVVPERAEVGVVLASVDRSLTIFEMADPGSIRTVGLGAEGTPVSLAVRGGVAVVPMGIVPIAVVVELQSGTVRGSIALPAGSGATGVAFLNDSIALVANPALNSVTPVNVRSLTAGASVDVGVYPQNVVVSSGRAYVINSSLENFVPTGPGTVTVLDAGTLQTLGAITLTGQNSGGAAFGPDGDLWVTHSGNFGSTDGSVSRVDPVSLTEVGHFTGFGEFPGGGDFGPSGRYHTSSFAYGIAVWDPATETFLRGPDDAVAPNGVSSANGFGFDPTGALWALSPTCDGPADVYRLDGSYQVTTTVTAGVCATDIAFGSVPVEEE